MSMTRREFTRLAASTILVAALPLTALAKAKETDDGDQKVAHAETGRRHEKAKKNVIALTHKCDFHWGYITVGKTKLPGPMTMLDPMGNASIIIDHEGNWQFSGSFIPCVLDTDVAVAIALKSDLGQVMTFAIKGEVTPHAGFSWTKQGHSAVVKDLWKEVVKGHDWCGNAVARRHHTASSGGGGENLGDEVLDGIKDVFGVLGTVFSFL